MAEMIHNSSPIHRIPRFVSVIIGVVIGIGLIIAVFAIITKLSRASDTAPRDVVISEVGKNAAKVSWTTDQVSQGVIEYGTSQTALNYYSPEVTGTKQHSVDLTLLSPGTTYYFQIRISDNKFDNGGVAWTFSTTSNTPASTGLPGLTPTRSPTILPTVKPSPIQSIEVGSPVAACSYGTDCQKIKSKLGYGCLQIDYIKCMEKTTATTPTPTLAITQAITPTTAPTQ